MASEGGGKIKQKRNQGSNKPYERKSSLFGKLKNSVKDLLIPSWLSRSSETTASDSSAASQTEEPRDEASGSRGGSRISNLASNKQGTGNSAPGDLPFIDLTQGESYEGLDLSGGPPPNLTISSGDSQGSQLSPRNRGASFSKISGFYKNSKGAVEDSVRLRMSDFFLDETDDQEPEPKQLRPIMVSTQSFNRSSNQADSSRQRLWSPEALRQGRPLVPPSKERPAFNSLLFGTPLKNDTSLLGDSFRESSFYSGKTRFGGASAAERKTKSSLNASLPYQSSLPLRKQVKAHRMNNSFNATTSATAQRILDTLDRISTPLGDAKRIPQADSLNDSILSFTPSSYRKTSLLGTSRPTTRPLQLPNRGPPTSQLHASSQASIARNRNRPCVSERPETQSSPTSGLVVSQEAVNVHERSVLSQQSERDNNGVKPGVGKVKTKKFSQHVSNTGKDSDDVMEIPNLRTDFTLPITSMAPIAVPQLGGSKSYTVTAVSIPSSVHAESSPLKFTFSTPIEEKKLVPGSNSPPAGAGGFKFSSPLQAVTTKTSAAGAEEGSKFFPEPAVGASSGVSFSSSPAMSSAPVPAWGSTAPKPKVASPDIGGTSSSFKSYNKWSSLEKESSASSDIASGAGFLTPAATLKSGSVMDILGGGKFSSPSSGPAPPPVAPKEDDLMAKFKKPPGAWDCDVCMVQNSEKDTQCVACESPKLGVSKPTSSQASSANSTSDDLMAKFRKPVGSWDCEVCMITNKADTDKCIACESLKPGSKPAPAPSSGPNDSLMAMFKKPAGSWECDTCMVQNSATALRCIACETAKPGLQAAGIVSKESNSSSGSSSITTLPTGGFAFNGGTTTTTTGSGGFQFGNTSTLQTAPSATGFKFGSSSTKDSASSFSGGFKFGGAHSTNNSASTSEVSSFVFGSVSNSSGDRNKSGGFMTPKTVTAGAPAAATQSSVSSSRNVEGSVTVSPSAETRSGEGAGSLPSPFSSSSVNSEASNNTVTPLSSTVHFGFTPGASGSAKEQPRPQDFGSSAEKNNQINFNFSGTSSSFAPSQTTLKTTALPTSAPAPASAGLFTFGAPVLSAASKPGTGLGLGGSLTSSHVTPVVNGGFGSSVDVQNSSAILTGNGVDSVKTAGGFQMGTPHMSGFGNVAAATSSNVNSTKRSMELTEFGTPTAKKSFDLAASGGKDSVTNGVFSFGSAVTNSSNPSTPSFGINATGFAFGSTSGPAKPQVAASFSFGAAAGAGTTTGTFNFSAKPQGDAGVTFDQPVATNGGNVSFNATPNFNFTAGTGSSPFQFAAKPAESSGQNLFTFGATPAPAAPSVTGMGTGGLGSFNMGSTGTAEPRKMKKALRRLPKK